MLLSAVSVLVVAQSSSEIPEGLTNNPVLGFTKIRQLAQSLLKWAVYGTVISIFLIKKNQATNLSKIDERFRSCKIRHTASTAC